MNRALKFCVTVIKYIAFMSLEIQKTTEKNSGQKYLKK